LKREFPADEPVTTRCRQIPRSRSSRDVRQLGSLAAPSTTLAAAFAGTHQPKPLKFDPARLDGLSERLIRSHHENNYVGSVKTLNIIEGRLAAALADKDLPPVVCGGLKREELHRTGSVVLHELYFDALGGNGQPGGDVATALGAAFGTAFGTWEADFRRTAMSLAGGSGWCVLAWNLHTASLHTWIRKWAGQARARSPVRRSTRLARPLAL
jgi:superoxide dismutase, Fe-Mn family